MNKEILNKLFELADESLKNKEFPVSAIIYDDDGIISYGYNKRNTSKLTIDHAEIMAITNANKKIGEWRLTNKCMVATLEPCPMCKAVIKEARLNKCYYLVPRYKFKKQNECTIFETLNLNTDNELAKLDTYKKNITTFFKDKR